MDDDSELLRRYGKHAPDAQAAFATLVQRHLDLVYSVALRTLRSPALAEEVAQNVFLDLARAAARFPADTPLAAWLHVVTRRTAIDFVRAESRRTAREQTAAALAPATAGPPSTDWPRIEPLLDEAVSVLPPADRTAILLRYFENRSLRDVGAALGISDDAAQKRITRALDQLRAHFVRHGVPLTTAALASELSAAALAPAPATLGAAISSAVSTVGIATVAAHVTAAAMTTVEKSLVTVALTLGLGAGVYEVTAFTRQVDTLAALSQRVHALGATLQDQRRAQAAAEERLRDIERQIDQRLARAAARLSSNDAQLEAQMRTWIERVDRLKAFLDRNPHYRTPALALVPDDAWFGVVIGSVPDSDDAIRRLLAQLRLRAVNIMGNKLQPALNAYLAAHHRTLPQRMADLLPYFDPPIAPALLDQYELRHSGNVDALPPQSQSELIATKAPVDVEHDFQLVLGTRGISMGAALGQNLAEARRAYAAANSGQRPATAAALKPFLRWPIEDRILEKFFSPPAASPRP